MDYEGGKMMHHTGTIELETKRLILRRFTLDDAAQMYENWASDTEVTRYLTWDAHQGVEITQLIVLTWLKNYEEATCYHWAMVYEGCVIGNVSLFNVNEDEKTAELGYCMSKAYWNQGLMTEAVKRVLSHAKTVGFLTVTGRHHHENVASGHVMKKCGLVLTHHDQIPHPKRANEWMTCCYYSKTL